MTKLDLMAGAPPSPEAQVTLENWRRPPFNRWGFQNARELVATAAIWRGAGTTRPLESDLRDLMHIEFTDHNAATTRVEQFLTNTQCDGLLVLHQGRIATERYFNGLSPHQPHILMSVSKSLSATLAGIFVSHGLLDPTQTVSGLIPEVSGSAFEDCKLQHILDMTVGVDFDEDYLANAGPIIEYREVSGWKPPTPATIDGDLRSWLPILQKTGEHGSAFHYVSPCTDLLGWIIERATGKAFHQLFSELIWEPMGAEFDAYITVDRLGAPRCAGGICVTLRDLARFGQLWLDRGDADGRQIIPTSWIDDTTSNYDRAAWRAGEAIESLPVDGYRNKWWIIGNDHGAYTGIGVHGQWLYVDPTAETVIAVFSSQPLPLDDDISADSFSCFDAILQAMQEGAP